MTDKVPKQVVDRYAIDAWHDQTKYEGDKMRPPFWDGFDAGFNAAYKYFRKTDLYKKKKLNKKQPIDPRGDSNGS